MPDSKTLETMREDWNRRAREDAHYYVAFGRHNQDDEEFFSTAYEIVYGLEFELKRMPAGNARARRALEIGCGPGRLIKPMSRNFGEIHGVDVSDEMLERARRNLAGVRHAHVHRSEGADLGQFADESFDFVYSYAVFQHIPSQEVVRSYWREARRVLKTGGLFWFQVNGLLSKDGHSDTWSGVRFTPEELYAFAEANDFQMYILEGASTQYMWTSWRKRPTGWAKGIREARTSGLTRIRAISNPHGTEPVVPNRGRFAVASLWVENLPQELGLNHLTVRIGEAWGTPNYIGAPLKDGLQQVNVLLPENTPTGLVPVRMFWCGEALGGEATMRVIPAGPIVPRLLSVTDATDLMAGNRIVSRAVKVTFEELLDPEACEVFLDNLPVKIDERFCSDPRPPRFEIHFKVAPEVPAGFHQVDIRVGRREFPPVWIEVVEGEGIAAPH